VNKKRVFYGKALVLGRDNRSFLSVVRSLGRNNIEVHGGFCAPDIAALQSRYLSVFHSGIDFKADSLEWKDVLISVLKEEKFDLVIPCEDTSAYYLHLFKEELSKYARFYLLDDLAYDVTRDKQKTCDLAKSLGIPVPRQTEIRKTGLIDLDKICTEFGFPVVIKPPVSFNKTSASRNFVKKAYSADEFKQIMTTVPDDTAVIIQENCIGTGIGVELLAHNGESLVAFQHERVHEPLMGGGSSYRKSVKPDPYLLEASKNILSALRYTGVAMVEFKSDPKTGRWVLLEINGRFWGSLPLPVSLGVDFPFYLYELFVHGKKSFPQNYRANRYCRNLPRDWLWMRQNYHADKTDPTLATRPMWKVVAEFFNILLLRESNDTLVLDDPKPGIAEFSTLFRNIRKEYTDKIIEKLTRRKAKKSFRKARCVLFVCKGNICRSPFASAVARLYTNKKIVSAGYYPYPNRKSPDTAILAAREFDIDISAHRSQIINKPLVNQADCIIVFDKFNLETLRDSFPYARHKIYLFGFLTDTMKEVSDPFNKDIDEFKKVYRQIKTVLEKFKRK
jgi:protein-tyrosine-phosphatase/predicted ATP-grasp superfamily ATP-dependent carboligase